VTDWTLDQWIKYANDRGLQCCNITQLDDGRWRVSMKVFGVSPELARNPVWTDYADKDTPEEAFAAVFASKRYRDAWEPKAALAAKLRKWNI
jgi:hypothetical protein